MQKPIKLYDFSAGNAVLVLLAYLCLICVLAGAAAGASNPLPYFAILAVLILSFSAICLYFVGLPVTLDEDGVHKGKTHLQRKAVRCTVFYNTRYREMSISFEDGSHTLRVQATKQNIAKAEAWLGHALEIPQKPKRFGK